MCAGCANFRKQLRVLRDLALTYAHGNAPQPDAHATCFGTGGRAS